MFLMHWGNALISNELGLRLFFLLLGCVNACLFYTITAFYFDKKKDRLLALFFYLMLPGVIVSTVLANDAAVITFLVLLFLYLYLHEKPMASLLPLSLLGLVHWSALYFYIVLMLYGLFQKRKAIFLSATAAILLFVAAGTTIPDPIPGNYFFETLGIGATIFSPLLFIYFFYALYRTLLRGERNLLWYISFGALMISLGLSLQERIKITDFSAYLMPSIIIAIHTYLGSLRVHLKPFQQRYKLSFRLIALSLLLSSLSLVLHQPIYRLLGETYYPVVAPVYVPYDKAKKLKTNGEDCVKESRQKVLYQMRYYGLKKCF